MDKTALEKVDSFVAHPIGENIVILNNKGVCVASSDNRWIGKIIDLNRKKTLKKIFLKSDLEEKIIIFYDRNKYNSKELELIKNLTKLTLEQYINKFSRPVSSVDQFVTALIEQPLNSERIALLDREAQGLGLNLEVHRAAILIEIKNFIEDNLMDSLNFDCSHEDVINDWKRKIISAISGFFTGKADIIVVYLGNNQFLCFKQIIGSQEKFIKYMKCAYRSIFGSLTYHKTNNLTVSFSNSHMGILGLYESYHEASQALLLGQKFIHRKNQTYYYGDLGTLRILTENNIEKKKIFAKEVLEPLNKEVLRLTLGTFLNENLDVKKTAVKLHIHPNTVNYRLGKIAEILGLDPRIFKQAFELRIALLTNQIFA